MINKSLMLFVYFIYINILFSIKISFSDFMINCGNSNFKCGEFKFSFLVILSHTTVTTHGCIGGSNDKFNVKIL